jgi:hypothetical protein
MCTAFRSLLAVAALLSAPFAMAQQTATDPPARIGALGAVEGSVVYAPAGQTDWTGAALNRPITRGDRVWTDEGARAELSFGASALQVASRTFVEVVGVDDDFVQLQLKEGTANARVHDLQGGESFEVDTPNLALRASRPGDWRVDVDPQQGFTRVAVHSGTATLLGANGGVRQVFAGEMLVFAGHNLAPVTNAPAMPDDGFDRWAADRNRAQDHSIAARYIPREVVGYQELDRHGTWAQDPTWGAVWYPDSVASDWAPYRHGHWESIAPWGPTWIDDAPWGFAPFHYGRWTMAGARWCWVPGPIGPRPVYAPALVGFVGSGANRAWYPLAPGEVWRPVFDASPMYVRAANRYLVTDSRLYNTGTPRFMYRPDAVTPERAEVVRAPQAPAPQQRYWRGGEEGGLQPPRAMRYE